MSTTPLRRSTRGVPLVSPAAAGPSRSAAGEGTTYTWLGEGRASSSSEGGRTEYDGFMRVSRGKSKSTKGKGKGKEQAEGPIKQLMFRTGDGVLIGTVGDIGVAVLTRLWEEDVRRDEGEDDEDMEEEGEGKGEKRQKMCEIRWCYRKQDLPGVMGRISVHEYEVLYASSGARATQTVPLSALVHTCTIIGSEAFRQLYPYYHESYKGRSKYVAVESSSDEDEDDASDVDGKKETAASDTDEDNHPPTLTLTISDRIFRRGKGVVSLVYYCTRAFDKAAKGGAGRAWWDVDVGEVMRRGREEGLWDVERPKVVPTTKAEEGATAGRSSVKKTRERPKKVDGRLKRSEGEQSDDASSAFEQDENEAESSDAGSVEDEESLPSADEIEDGPSRKRKRAGKSTPRKRPAIGTSAPKPYKSASLARAKAKARARAAADTNTFTSVPLALLPRDPFERALHLLHVGATPDSLPKRETEYLEVLSRVQEGVETGNGSCLYIAGVPGTGKTATVHAVIKDLRRQVEEYEIPPFSYVEINGLKIPTPQHAYAVLWDAISGTTGSSAKTALRSLEEHFGAIGKSGGVRGPRGHTFVVLMDELDQLLTAKQDVVYNFFNWPTLRDSQLFVIAVANRMDLPQQLAAKVKSRLGMQSLYFQPYDREALMAIAHSRLVAHPDDTRDPQVLHPEAIRLAAMKMAGTNGDARRVLDACRRAVEVSIGTGKKAGRPPSVVSVKDMQIVLKALTSSPVAVFIKQCSLYEKVLLAAILRCVRREGVPEVSWLSVCRDSDNLIKSMFDAPAILSNAELQVVFSSLLATRTLTYSNERYKVMDDRKLALGLGMDANEVGRVLMAEGESWARVLAGL